MLNQALQRAVTEAARLPAAERLHLVQCSSSGATGAIIFHGWVDGDTHPRVVVKTARDARLNHALRHEWRQVVGLRAEAGLADLVPEALAAFTIDTAEYFAYEGAAGRTMYSQFRNRVVALREAMLRRFAAQALAPISRVHETATRALPAATVAEDLLGDLEWLESSIPGFPRSVSTVARDHAERLAQVRLHLPCGRIHGDYSPYNVLTTSMAFDAGVRVIDWEHTEADRPQHLDILRFVGASTLLGLRGRARLERCRTMERHAGGLLAALLRPWLARFADGAAGWLEPRLLETLWWHYWIHAARREQERRAHPDDVVDSTYVTGLELRAVDAGLRRPARARAV